jgi:hypothetical protein
MHFITLTILSLDHMHFLLSSQDRLQYTDYRIYVATLQSLAMQYAPYSYHSEIRIFIVVYLLNHSL